MKLIDLLLLAVRHGVRFEIHAGEFLVDFRFIREGRPNHGVLVALEQLQNMPPGALAQELAEEITEKIIM